MAIAGTRAFNNAAGVIQTRPANNLQMNKDQGLQFRAYVPTLMELLEDADGMVRDVAKSTVIDLFRLEKILPSYMQHIF